MAKKIDDRCKHCVYLRNGKCKTWASHCVRKEYKFTIKELIDLGYNWITLDKDDDNFVYAYSNKPKKENGMWVPIKGKVLELGTPIQGIDQGLTKLKDKGLKHEITTLI